MRAEIRRRGETGKRKGLEEGDDVFAWMKVFEA
jgi:hypothetical protein